MYIRSTSRAFKNLLLEKTPPKTSIAEDELKRFINLERIQTMKEEQKRSPGTTCVTLFARIQLFHTSRTDARLNAIFSSPFSCRLLLSVIKNKFRQTVRTKRFLEFWRLTKHQARTTNTRRIVAIQIYVSFRPFRRSSRAVSDQFLVWKKAVSSRKQKSLARFFESFVFLRHFRFCASPFLHKSSSFFFESVTREEQNPIRTPWSR